MFKNSFDSEFPLLLFIMYLIADIYDQLVRDTSLINCALKFLGPKDWQLSRYTTWANPENTYKHMDEDEPQINDHIFLKVNAPENVKVKTTAFDVQILKTPCPIMTVEPTNTCPNMLTSATNLNLTTCPNFPPKTTKESVYTPPNWIDQTLRFECGDQDMISLSDHEAITASIRIEKHKPGNIYKKI